MPAERFWVRGVVRERESGRPLPDLVVRAFDRDLVFDDCLGATRTDGEGRFRIAFTAEVFQDLLEKRPDLYLRVLDRGGVRELLSTRAAVRRDAGRDEQFELEVPAARLAPG